MYLATGVTKLWHLEGTQLTVKWSGGSDIDTAVNVEILELLGGKLTTYLEEGSKIAYAFLGRFKFAALSFYFILIY